MERKKFEELNVIDNFMFNELAMQADPNKSKRFFSILLKTILNKEIKSLTIIPQRMIQGRDMEYHGIQTDSYVEAYVYDGEETSIVMPIQSEIYDIEPNTYKESAVEKRMRYYHALIDTILLSAGLDYKNMKNVTLIMISNHDPFHCGRMVYTFETHCVEEPDLNYEDGLKTIYLYTGGAGEKDREELSDMLKFIADSRRDNAISPEMCEIYDMMSEIKNDAEKGIRYMKSWEIEEMRFAQGVEEGIKEGMIFGAIKTLRAFGHGEEEIKALIMEQYNLSEKEAIECMADKMRAYKE